MQAMQWLHKILSLWLRDRGERDTEGVSGEREEALSALEEAPSDAELPADTAFQEDLSQEECQKKELPLFTVVVQGRLHRHSLESLAAYREVGAVVISHYDDDDLSLLDSFDLTGVTRVTSPFWEKVQAFNRWNCYYQVTTTMAGLYCVNTPYVIKVRSDEKYRTLQPVVESVLSHPQALTCTDIYLFPYAFQPLHPSDHLMAGTFSNLARTFQEANRIIQDLKEMSRYVYPSRIPTDADEYVEMRKRMEKMGKYIVSSELIFGHAFARVHGLEPHQVTHTWQKTHFRMVLADSLGCLNKNGVPWKTEHGSPTWPDVYDNEGL